MNWCYPRAVDMVMILSLTQCLWKTIKTTGFIALFPTGSKTNLGPETIQHEDSICCEVVSWSMDTQKTYKVVPYSMETWARNTWKTVHVIFQCYFLQLQIVLVVFIRNRRKNLPKQAHNWHVNHLFCLLCGLLFKITQWTKPAGVFFPLVQRSLARFSSVKRINKGRGLQERAR